MFPSKHFGRRLVATAGAAALCLGGLALATAPSQAASKGRFVMPASVDFGTVTLEPQVTRSAAATSTRTITLKNDQRGRTGRLKVALVGPNAVDFRIIANGCSGRKIAARKTCSVTVSFAPSTTGTKAATLGIRGKFKAAQTALRGQAISDATPPPPTGPVLVADKTTAAFGDVAAGDFPNMFIVVTNEGDSAISFVSTTVPMGFQVAKGGSNCDNATLLPGGTCDVSLTFIGQAAGDYSGNVVVRSSFAATSATIAVSATRLGAQAASPVLTSNTASYSFGSVFTGAVNPTSGNLVVSNTGSAATAPLSVTMPDGFELVTKGDDCEGPTLIPGGLCFLDIRFVGPLTSGSSTTYSGQVVVSDGTVDVKIPVSGTRTDD